MWNKTVLPRLGGSCGGGGGGGIMPRQPENEKDGLRETHSINIFFAHKIELHNF